MMMMQSDLSPTSSHVSTSYLPFSLCYLFFFSRQTPFFFRLKLTLPLFNHKFITQIIIYNDVCSVFQALVLPSSPVSVSRCSPGGPRATKSRRNSRDKHEFFSRHPQDRSLFKPDFERQSYLSTVISEPMIFIASP